MAWISKILFFIFFLLLANYLRSVLVRVFTPLLRPSAGRAGGQNRNAPQTKSGTTVKDPQCGVYVAESLAIPAQVDGRTLHFCSEECRNRYLEQRPSSDRAGAPAP